MFRAGKQKEMLISFLSDHSICVNLGLGVMGEWEEWSQKHIKNIILSKLVNTTLKGLCPLDLTIR